MILAIIIQFAMNERLHFVQDVCAYDYSMQNLFQLIIVTINQLTNFCVNFFKTILDQHHQKKDEVCTLNDNSHALLNSFRYPCLLSVGVSGEVEL